MRSKISVILGAFGLVGLLAGMVVGIGCGRPDDASMDQAHGGSEYIPVDGLAAYGTQCPYGDVDPIKPLRMQMWNCPITTGRVHLEKDIAPLFLQADCKSRILTARTLDRKIDTSWYFLPNGEFDVVIDGLTAGLSWENNSCNAALAVNIIGKIECGSSETTLDRATIRFQSVMWAGKRIDGQGRNPVVVPSPGPDGTALPAPPMARTELSNPCNLPQSCYFFTQTELKQCQ